MQFRTSSVILLLVVAAISQIGCSAESFPESNKPAVAEKPLDPGMAAIAKELEELGAVVLFTTIENRRVPGMVDIREPKKPLSDLQLKALSQLPFLTILRFDGSSVPIKSDLEFLEGLPSLESLILHRVEIHNGGMERIGGCKNLEFLHLTECRIDEREFLKLTKLPKLRHLFLSGILLKESHIAHIRQIAPNIETLSRGYTEISNGEVEQISRMVGLKTLALKQTTISDDDLTHLSTLPKLEVLDISNTNITDKSVSALAEIKMLRTLTMSQTKISIEGIKSLKRLNPRLEIND